MITLEEFMLFWLGLALAVQLFFIWVIFGRLAFYKEEALGNLDLPPISVVVAAQNEYENLQKLVPALLAQNYPDFQVVIVDDRSYDESYDYLLKQQAEHPRLKLCRIAERPEHINGKKFALTMGIKAAEHETLLLTDADCLPNSPDWIRGMMSRYQERTEVVLGFSQYEKKPGFLNKFIRFETFFVGVQYLSFALWGRPYMGVGRNLSYKKPVFFRQKGFLKHQHITGGDDDLLVNKGANRKNTRISISEDSQTTSVPHTKVGEWYHQKKRHLSVGKEYKTSDMIVLGVLMLSYIGFYFMLGLALLAKVPYEWVLGAYGVRMLSLLIVFQLIRSKMNKNFELYLVPFMDIAYIFYYIVVGTVARKTKRIAWRK